ncbi:MAG TPA: hypothetical protein VHH34_08900 [Pseudonocardiaceae bacterium]|nr:hypothetical protein [Pseudonocardiaceae bacterium]
MRDYTIVAYHRGRPDMRRRIDGNYSNDALGPGDVSLMTRAADSRWTWSRVLIFLGQDEVAETCHQMYDREVSDATGTTPHEFVLQQRTPKRERCCTEPGSRCEKSPAPADSPTRAT